MNTFVILLAVAVATCHGQFNRDPKTAQILQEQRYLSVNGAFGSAYNQEDGVQFKEESDADGNRRGSYSYVDPSGQRRTISYVAGKNGFQATGDHLPQAPAAPPQPVPTPGYQPLPQYQPPAPVQQPQSNNGQYDDGSYNPALYENQNYNSAPAPAQPSFQTPPAFQPSFQSQPIQQYNPPQPAYNPPQPAYNPPPQQYNPAPQPQYNSAPQFPTTPAPHRFYPPGKLSLNRSPDGFTYTFNKA